MFAQYRISVVIPAQNEARAIGHVLGDLASLQAPDRSTSLIDDVVVCNNGSTDETGATARRFCAAHAWRVVDEPEPGYGAACLKGIAALPDAIDSERIVVFVDGDCSVKVDEMPRLLQAIVDGADLVIGNRLPGNRERRSMTLPQRMGNSLASLLIRLLWNHPVNDLGPFRAIRAIRLSGLGMTDRRFGWTVEMQVRGIQQRLNIREVPVSTLARVGRSKISGTVRGVVLAGHDILTTIFNRYIEEKRGRLSATNAPREKLP